MARSASTATCCSGTPAFCRRLARNSHARLHVRSIGWTIVVSAGHAYPPSSLPSQPAMRTSSGIRYPRSRSARQALTAISSLKQNRAPGSRTRRCAPAAILCWPDGCFGNAGFCGDIRTCSSFHDSPSIARAAYTVKRERICSPGASFYIKMWYDRVNSYKVSACSRSFAPP